MTGIEERYHIKSRGISVSSLLTSFYFVGHGSGEEKDSFKCSHCIVLSVMREFSALCVNKELPSGLEKSDCVCQMVF